MSLDLPSWNQVVKKKWATSNQFKELDTAVRAYIARQDAGNLNQMQTKWAAWTQRLATSNKTYQTSDRYVAGCALDDVAALCTAAAAAAPSSSSSSSSSGPTDLASLMQKNLAKQVAARDQMSSERGTTYKKDSTGKFQMTIFSQEQTYSCTCACACTFANYLTGTSLKEDIFRSKYNEVTGAAHDFSAGGSFFPPIAQTLQALKVDAVHHDTPSLAKLKDWLNNATPEVPVLVGVVWKTSNGSPGGGHAVLCKGPGKLLFTAPASVGYVMEDPYPDHDQPGMFDDGTYWVLAKSTNSWCEAQLWPDFGCVVGKKSQMERGKAISHTKGVKVM